MTAQERLARARANEDRKAAGLCIAAERFAAARAGAGTGPLDALKAAAKAWTNAMHQRSRCEKHAREEGNA